MALTIYEWSGDYFCSGCVVYALTEVEPWSQWLDDEDHDRSAQSTDATLDLIADSFGIGMNRNARRESDFPIRLRLKERPAGTHFCRTCLALLTMEANHET